MKETGEKVVIRGLDAHGYLEVPHLFPFELGRGMWVSLRSGASRQGGCTAFSRTGTLLT